MKIDIFNHILPQPYFERMVERLPDRRMLERYPNLPTLWDLDERLRLLEAFDDYVQVLSLANPTIEALAGPEESPALARLANDEMAKVCAAHPDRFPGFIASLPMNAPDAAVAEADRAVRELGARGVQVFTNVNGKPLSAPEFEPVFALLAGHDLPVWVHPVRGPNHPDYLGESRSEHEIWFTFGWPYETSACMARLIFSGLFDRLPGVKVITHHMGGMIPFFAEKIAVGMEQTFARDPAHNPLAGAAGLKRQPIDYYRILYADTALNGSHAATACGHAFFGTDHALFATDFPFDPTGGRQFIEDTAAVVDALPIPAEQRAAIFAGNARRLLRL